MNIKRLFFLFNGFQFFFSLLLWLPIFYEYQKTLGLNDTEIFRIQSLYYLFFCLLEIPTGFLADKLGYRLCLIIGSFILILSHVAVPLIPTYEGFLGHFILLALARSFASGASSAYLYETLSQKGHLHAYKEAEGRARAYSLVGKVVCWAMVGVIMKWHFTLPYWLTAANAFLSLIFALLLPDTKQDAGEHPRTAPFFLLLIVLFKRPILILLMFQGVALFVLARICQVNLFQPLLAAKGFSVTSYGVIMAAMTLFEALGSFRSEWVKKYFSDLNAIFFATLLIGLSFYVLSSNSFGEMDLQVVTVMALCFFSYVIGISFPIQKKLINEAIPEPALRASLLSSESLIDRGVNSWVASSLGLALSQGELFPFIRKSAHISILSILLIAGLMRWVMAAQKKKGLAI